MHSFLRIHIALGVFFLSGFSHSEEDAASNAESPPDYPVLETKDGKQYNDCYILESDQESLLVKHRGGIARVSLFDLDAEIQAKYEFDPIEALKVYKDRLEAERERRKSRLLEAEKFKAEQDRLETIDRKYETAELDWTPVEAKVLRTTESGAFVKARKVVFEPRFKKSTLGFTVPDTPERKLVPFGKEKIFLEFLDQIPPRGKTWKGYVNPASLEMKVDPANRKRTVPVHEAISNRP